MSKLTLIAQLNNAKTRLSRAEENCAHWDYEASHNCDHACCDEVWQAQNQYLDLKRKVKLAEAA